MSGAGRWGDADQALRALAERQDEAGTAGMAGTAETLLRQLHQLQLSQLELEMQSAALAELQQIKEAFESGLNRYAELYDLAPVSYFSIGRSGHISRANAAAAQLLKTAKAELLGRKFEQFLAPEAQARFRQFNDAVFELGTRQVLEAQLFEGVSEMSLVRIEASIERDGAHGVCRMIVTDLGDPEVRASALRRAFLILDSINEGVMVTDGASRIVSVNPSFTTITGYPAEEAIGRNPAFLGNASEPPGLYREILTCLGGGASWQGEVPNCRKDGTPLVLWLSMTPMWAADGGSANYLGIFSDITERKRAEQALRELHRELDERVVARTEELTLSNRLLHQEIGERRRAEAALRDAERFFHATIDSLSDRVLVLDASGGIVHANRACVGFAGYIGVGTSYLAHCAADARWQRGAGPELVQGIRAVIGGTLDAFTLEYEFHAHVAYWFQARVSRFAGQGPLRVVVAHTDITERKAMEGALLQSQAQLRQLALHLETAKEDERKRISRDIHDELGQNLLVLRIDLSMLSARTGASHPRLQQRLDTMLGNVDTTIKSVRGIMNALRPLVLDLGLQTAMEWQIGDFSKRSGIACGLLVADETLFARIGGDSEIVLFRIVQEALSNVLRHAGAQHAEVALSADGGGLCLQISDDGIGIAPHERRKSQCFGLIGIAERISALGGRFDIAPFSAGQGCRLIVRIPLERLAAAQPA